MEVLFLYITRVLFLSRFNLLTRSKNSTNVPPKLDVVLCLDPFLSHLLTATAQVSTELLWTLLSIQGKLSMIKLELWNKHFDSPSKFRPNFWVETLDSSWTFRAALNSSLLFQTEQKRVSRRLSSDLF